MKIMLLINLFFSMSCYSAEQCMTDHQFLKHVHKMHLQNQEVYKDNCIYFYDTDTNYISLFTAKKCNQNFPLQGGKLYNYAPFTLDDLIGKNGIFDMTKNNFEDSKTVTFIDRIIFCMQCSTLDPYTKEKLEALLNAIQPLYCFMQPTPYKDALKNKILYHLKYFLYQHEHIRTNPELFLNQESTFIISPYNDPSACNNHYHYFLSHIKEAISNTYSNEATYYWQPLKINACLSTTLLIPWLAITHYSQDKDIVSFANKAIPSTIASLLVFTYSISRHYFEFYYNVKKCIKLIESEKNNIFSFYNK